MFRSRNCKIGRSVLLALLLSVVNTVIILVYLGPANVRNNDAEHLPGIYSSQTQGSMANSETMHAKEPEIQKISVVNQYDDIDFPSVLGGRDNSSINVEIFSNRNNILPKQDDNLDYAYKTLKFNRNKMSMVGQSPVKPVDIVIGIPTVKRDTTDYISSTVRSLAKYLNKNETRRCHIVVFAANVQEKSNEETAAFIRKEFAKEVSEGLIEVVKPDFSFYPNLNNLPLLWKDKPDRVKWRSKQCVDYALLFLYCRSLGNYYLQLEDDVSVSQTYFREIINFIRLRHRENWSNLQFGTGGFIGMMFKSSDLARLALFVKMYYWIFPVDILFRHFNDVHLYGNSPKDIYHPPLFKHLGRESSLKGQTRRIGGELKKKSFFDTNRRRYTDSNNPSAFLSTNIKVYESNTIDGPYKTLNIGYFWGKAPKLNDFIVIEFMKELTLRRVVFESGSQFAPNDILLQGKLETTGISKSGNCDEQNYKLLSQNTNKGMIDSGTRLVPHVKCVKLTITKPNLDVAKKERWLLIREIAVWSR